MTEGRSSRAGLGLGARARSESVREMRRHLRVVRDPDLPARPKTRAGCADVPRPCPFVSCKYNLFIDVTDVGSVRFNFPDREPAQMPANFSCALDVADMGGGTFDDIARFANVTRQGLQFLERKALASLKKRPRALGDFADEFGGERKRPLRHAESMFRHMPAHEASEQEQVDEPSPTRMSFFASADVDTASIDEAERADAAVCDAVWRMFAKDANGRGYACRSTYEKAASERQRARRRARKEDAMRKKRGEMQRLTLEAFRACEARLGRVPTAKDVFSEMGEDAAKSERNVAAALSVLRRHGRIDPPARARGGRPREEAAGASSAARASPDVEGGETGVVSSENDDVVRVLLARREALIAKVSAISAAIEALR